MPKRPKYEAWRPEDDPKVGDIWRRAEVGNQWHHYLLLEQLREFDTCLFIMLNMTTGETGHLFMNFELDDWRWVA